ncbi:putative YigZ family protein [Pedobacter sp. UYP30]|uniref:IMPACT family protein n=1 Tax=Pedobacter sp. UYP30 TaxID=1756400 RepID=UPI0033992913
MESTDHFKTIAAVAEAIFSDKGSKFIGSAYPIKNEEETKSILLGLKSQHKKARHFCYAYRLNADGLFRANDDGEPAGSAGKPILNCLLSAELENVMIVVVRYFGGKLLGVPGLINAYKTASIMSLSEAIIIDDFQKTNLKVSFDYVHMNDVMQILKEEGLEVYEQQFDLACELKFWVKKSLEDQISHKLDSIPNLKLKAIINDDTKGLKINL